MAKYLLLSLTFLAYLLPLSAQNFQIGVRAGYNLSGIGGQGLTANQNANLLFDNRNLAQSNLKYISGFHLGGYAQARVQERYGFEGGVFFSTRGYQYSYSENYISTGSGGSTVAGQASIQEDYNAYYIDVPLLARAYLWKGLNLVVGLQPSVMVSNRFTREVTGDARFTRSEGDFRTFDVALVTGLGYQFESGLNLNLVYDSGLLGIDTQLDPYQYHRVLKASVGYSFRK